MEERIPERMCCLIDLQEAADRAGDRNQSGSENDGHDAAHVQLQRQIAVLPAHLLAAHHALCILDGDAALSIRHDDDEHDHDQCQHDQQGQQNVELGLTGRGAGQQTRDRGVDAGPVGNDRGEDQKGDTVADSLVIDLLTTPSDQLSTGGEGGDDDHGGKDTGRAVRVLQCTHIADHEVVAEAHHQSDDAAGVPGDLLQLALAVRLLRDVFQRRDRNGEQLHNDGGVDIRCHT